MRRFFITFILGFAMVYLALAAFLYFSQRSLLYIPDTNRYPPEMAGLSEMKDVRFDTPDGLTISGWYKKAPKGRPTIVYFHGNGGNNLNHSEKAGPLIKEGYGVFLLEYRGYGGNPGSPTEEGLYNDARGGLEFLKNQGVIESDIILFGMSLGSGVAVKMATETSPKALLLQSPYTSISAVAQGQYWYMPVKWLIKDKFASLDLIAKIKAPLLVLVGTSDRVIPNKFSYELFDAANDPKALEVFKNIGHNDMDRPEVMAAVFKFLNELE